MEQIRLSFQQSQFFKSQNVDIYHKSHQLVNENIFSFDIGLTLIVDLYTKGLYAGQASVLGLFMELYVLASSGLIFKNVSLCHLYCIA